MFRQMMNPTIML